MLIQIGKIEINPVELENLLQTPLEKKEIIPLEFIIQWLPKKVDNPWTKFAGIFQDNPDFAEIAESLRNECLANNDEDEREQD